MGRGKRRDSGHYNAKIAHKFVQPETAARGLRATADIVVLRQSTTTATTERTLSAGVRHLTAVTSGERPLSYVTTAFTARHG